MTKGAKKILSGLNLVPAFANILGANGKEDEVNGKEDGSEWWLLLLAILASVGALSLVRWLWEFIVMKFKNEIGKLPSRQRHRRSRTVNRK